MEELRREVVCLVFTSAGHRCCANQKILQLWRRCWSLKIRELTFVRNRGELAEGWYDPVTLRKARASAASTAQTARRYEPSGEGHQAVGGDSSDDDAVGPALPGDYSGTKEGKRSGPAIPNLQDLELQRGMSSLEYTLALNAILESSRYMMES